MPRISLCCILLIALSSSIALVAQPEIDNAFGKQIHTNGHGGGVKDMLVQSDGKIVMVSGCPHFEDLNYPFCALRLNPNGGYDSTFVGSGNRIPGIVRTRPTPITTAISGETYGVAQQSDGKLVLVGYIFLPGPGLVLGMVRYHPDGLVDTSFGTSGFVGTDVTQSLNDWGRKVAIQPDGKILVVGSSNDSTSTPSNPKVSELFVARYTSAGVLDNSFGTGGIFKPSFPGDQTIGSSIALQADGKILVGGDRIGAQSSYLLIRLNTDGTPDTTWDGDGYLTVAHNTPIALQEISGFVSIAIQSDGRIVALADSTNQIYRVNPDSSLDLTFAGVGFRSALQSSVNARFPFDLALSPGGRIIVVGQSRPDGLAYQYETALFMDNGEPDLNFGGDGFQGIDMASSLNDGARAVAVDGQGRILVGGLSALGSCGVCWPWSQSSFSVTRLLAPVSAVGVSGRVTRSDGRPIMNALLTTQDISGTTRTARSNPFGYYRFLNLPIGQLYTVSARAKGFVFTDAIVTAGSDITNLDLVGVPE